MSVDVLRKRPGEDRQTELDMKNNQEYSDEAALDAHVHKLSGIGDDSGGSAVVDTML
jgi:hypothetical protein